MQFLPKDTRSKRSTFNTAPDQVSLADAGFVEVPNEWYNCMVQDCNQQSSVCKKKCGQLASWLSCMITKVQQYLNHPHFLSVFFFFDAQHFDDGSTSSPGYSVIGDNPGLFKFWSLSRSFEVFTSIPESKSTLATFQLTPSRVFVHP